MGEITIRQPQVGIRTRRFLSDPSSSPARARIQRIRPLLSDDDVYIKVKQIVCLSHWSEFKTGRNYCAAQVEIHSPRPFITLESSTYSHLQTGSDLTVGPFGPTTAFFDGNSNPKLQFFQQLLLRTPRRAGFYHAGLT
jgi:hypothetical protein